MDLGLQGQVVVVAASSKGLGRATALQLAQEGARVVISGRDEDTLADTARQIEAESGSEVEAVVTDLTVAEDAERLISRAVERFGSLDALITNSGGPPAGNFDDFEDEAWISSFELNLLSVVRLIKAALPHMRERGYGRILNFTSSSIKQPIDGLILSNTYRAGVLGLAKSLSGELAPQGILINTIGPGRIGTDRVGTLDGNRAQKLDIPVEEVRRRAEANIPLGRYGEPEEFAKVATFLVSRANTYLTGQAILVDGGMVRGL